MIGHYGTRIKESAKENFLLASDPTYSRVEYNHLFIQSKSKLIIIIKAVKHKKLINVANNASAKKLLVRFGSTVCRKGGKGKMGDLKFAA